MSFWGSLFGGSSPQLNSLIGQFGQAGSNMLGQGQSYTNQAGNFYSSLLSGDATKQAQVLSPEISAAKTRNQQTQKANSMFGTRSGGTAASNAASSDALHGQITNLIGGLTGNAAGALSSLGTSLTGQGLGALGQEQGAVQQQMSNWENSILGRGITGAISGAESFGLGAAGGALAGVNPGQAGLNSLYYSNLGRGKG